MTQTLKPLEAPFDPDLEATLSRYPSRDGYVLALFRVFANSHRFLNGKGVVNLLDKESPLPLRQREIVILRVCANCGCEYEWGVHVAGFSKAAELTAPQVRATRLGNRGDEAWSREDQLLVDVVDELTAHSDLSDVTKADFEAAWSLEQQLEILALCGNYQLVSMVANVARLAPEPFGLRW